MDSRGMTPENRKRATLRSQLFAGKGKHPQSQFGSRVSFAKSTLPKSEPRKRACWLMIFGSRLNDHFSGFESGGDLTPSTEAPTEPWDESGLGLFHYVSLEKVLVSRES